MFQPSHIITLTQRLTTKNSSIFYFRTFLCYSFPSF